MTEPDATPQPQKQTPQARFGAMRAVLHGPTTARSFRQLCALLDAEWAASPERVTSEWLPYVEDHITRWCAAAPPAVRWDALAQIPFWEDPCAWGGAPVTRAMRGGAPWLPFLRGVSVDADVFAAFDTLPALPALRSLQLQRTALDGDGLRRLAAWPSIAGLEALVLELTGDEHHGLQELLDSPYMPTSLRLLDLFGVMYHDGALEALFASGVLRSVEALNLWEFPDDERLAGMLMEAIDPARLWCLCAASMDDSTPLAHALAANPRVDGLRALDMQGARGLSPDSIEALVCAPHLQALEILGAGGWRMNAAQLDALTRGALPMLRQVDLSWLDCLAAHHGPTLEWLRGRPLEHLDFSRNELRGDALARLLDALEGMPLHTLSLWGCSITDDHIDALLTWPGLGALEHLDLGRNPLTSEGARRLLDAGVLRQGMALHLDGQAKTEEISARLTALACPPGEAQEVRDG